MNSLLSVRENLKSGGNNNYQTFRKIWKEAHPSVSRQQCDQDVAKFWNCNKDDENAVQNKIGELKLQIKNRRNPIETAFLKQYRNSKTEISSKVLSEPVGQNNVRSEQDEVPRVEDNDESIPPISAVLTIQSVRSEPERSEPDVTTNSEVGICCESTNRKTPAESKYKEELDNVNKQIVSLVRVKETGLFFTAEMNNKLTELTKRGQTLESTIRRLQINREAAKKARMKRKHNFQKLENLPEVAKILKTSSKKGRPRLEEKQTGLTKAILDIVTRNCSADEKRRCETLLSNMRLKNLVAELKSMGFCISRSGLSLRFKPRNKQSIWGRRHISTVNVKLARAVNTLRKHHSDSHFAAATIRFLHDIAELFGNKNVMVFSVDDKAKVPLGITAAKSQSPVLMRMDYEVRLPDHDFAVGTRHKLIPSVYAGLCMNENKLSYSGPTYIAVRSGKHDGSTAESHADDIDRMLSVPMFDYFTKNGGSVKPIMIMFTDGGPDENPRFPKTLTQAIRHFKNYNLDALFIATNAPGQSASNPVERRMAPLSRELCSVILPHQHYGSHLNASGKTVDKSLEVKNFDKAGHLLAKIWDGKKIDEHRVFAEYVHPPNHPDCLIDSQDEDCCSDHLGADSSEAEQCAIDDFNILEEECETEETLTESIPPRKKRLVENATVSEEWKVIHVRQSQYCLQITKCFNRNCCDAPKTNILQFLPERFIPAPVLYKNTGRGKEIAEIDATNGHFLNLQTRLSLDFLKISNALQPLPFDWFCPSVKQEVPKRICNTCGIYFPSQIALKQHCAYHGSSNKNNIEVSESIDNVIEIEEDDDGITVIDSIDEWFSPLFVEIV